VNSTCPIREAAASPLLAVAQLAGLEPVAVNFGSWEHPEPGLALYVGRAELWRFHWVKRAGHEVRVHDHQFSEEFRAALNAQEVLA
jgi:hypothetical protein